MGDPPNFKKNSPKLWRVRGVERVFLISLIDCIYLNNLLFTFKQAQDRLLKELNTAQIASHDAAPQYLLQSLLEETEVARFMVKQKLPQEIATKTSEIQILDEVMNHPSITRGYLNDLQEQVK